MKKLEPIGAILNRFLAESGLEDQIQTANMLQLWAKTVGPAAASHTRALTIKEGTLYVEVDNSAWLQQLTYLKKCYIEKLNEQAGSRSIRNIHFKMANQELKPNKWIRKKKKT